jgi:hypothetical protein
MSALERSTYRSSECSSGTHAISARREKVRSASNGYSGAPVRQFLGEDGEVEQQSALARPK